MSTSKPTGKDIHRFSFSRFKTFHTCPRKHNYQYIEQIVTEENQYTIPGKLFHKCIEQFLKNEDMSETIEEFRKLCMVGTLDMEPDLLEYVVSKYLQYYAKDYSLQKTLLVEKEYTESLEGDDYITLVVDQAYEWFGATIIRDIKTTQKKLKYTLEDVIHNQQLLLYLPYVENDLGVKVDAVQIDEVRFAKLQDVPINNNGKPTADKRRLDLVCYEDYYELLCSMGLETEKEYQPALDYLRERGHPLFNRITAQVLDQAVVDANAQDMLATYYTIKSQEESTALSNTSYRIKGPLCNYCPFKELCEHDMHALTTAEREMLIEKIQKNNS